MTRLLNNSDIPSDKKMKLYGEAISKKRICNVKRENEFMRLLNDSEIPSDKKMKLYGEAISKKRLQTTSSPLPPSTTRDIEVNNFEVNFPVKDRPHVHAIVEFMLRHPRVISWNSDREIIVGENLIHGSDILDILRYFTGNVSITRDSDNPLGIEKAYEALMSAGLPNEWIKKKPPSLRTPRSKRRKSRKATEAPPLSTPRWKGYHE